MSPTTRRRLSRAARIGVPVVILGIILFAVSTTAFIQVSSTPWFCGSCHIMKPYYQSWEKSNHRDVACIQCHIAPGIKAEAMTKVQAANMVVKYFTGTATTRPWAKLEDAACLRSGCHSTRLIEGEVDYKGVRFDHTKHLGQVRRGIELHCTSCHSQIVQGSHIAVTENTCALCHFKGRPEGKPVATCTGCHPSPPRVTSKEGYVVDHPQFVKDRIDCLSCHNKVTQGTGDADPARCVSCHNETSKLAQTKDAAMLHRVHVGQEHVECVQCHTALDHKIVSLATKPELDCKSCHKNTHAAEQQLYAGVGGHAVARGPSSMFQARVSCVGCHNDASRMPGHDTIQVANGAACMSCHGVRYANVLPGWQEGMNRKLDLVEPIVRQAKDAATSLPLRERAVADSLLGQASDNVSLVRAGKGVHNIMYADQLLRASVDLVKQASSETRMGYRPPAIDLGPSVGDNQCMECHLGVEQRKELFDKRSFDHSPHVINANLPCSTCHSSFDDHGKTTLASGASCDNCHHQPLKSKVTNCARCHSGPGGTPSDTLYRPQGNFTHQAHLAANVECASCHAAPTMSAKNLNCDGCHTQHHQTQAVCISCHQGGALAKHKAADHVACAQCHKTVPQINAWSRQVCLSCHAAQAEHQVGKACETCHKIPPMKK